MTRSSRRRRPPTLRSWKAPRPCLQCLSARPSTSARRSRHHREHVVLFSPLSQRCAEPICVSSFSYDPRTFFQFVTSPMVACACVRTRKLAAHPTPLPAVAISGFLRCCLTCALACATRAHPLYCTSLCPRLRPSLQPAPNLSRGAPYASSQYGTYLRPGGYYIPGMHGPTCPCNRLPRAIQKWVRLMQCEDTACITDSPSPHSSAA